VFRDVEFDIERYEAYKHALKYVNSWSGMCHLLIILFTQSLSPFTTDVYFDDVDDDGNVISILDPDNDPEQNVFADRPLPLRTDLIQFTNAATWLQTCPEIKEVKPRLLVYLLIYLLIYTLTIQLCIP